MPSDDVLAKFPKEMRHLLKKGRSQGFVTNQELMKVFPEAENQIELIDEAFTLFFDLGIEVVDVKDKYTAFVEFEKDDGED